MYLFKRQILEISFLIFILVSCAGREKHSEGIDFSDSNAPFIVEQITKPKNLSKAINFIEKDGLKDVFIINLSTCLKDAFKIDNSIQEAPFVIEYQNNIKEGGEKTKIQVRSDVNGCIQWEEEYKFRYILNPTWIVLKRSIKKEGGAFNGQVDVPLAVNPWLLSNEDKFPEILDLRAIYSKQYPVFKKHPYKKDGLKFLSENNPDEYPQLWAPVINLQIEKELPKKIKTGNESIKALLAKYQNVCKNKDKEDCYKRHLKISLTVPLKLRTYGLQKHFIDDEVVRGGSYDVNLQLLVIPEIQKSNYRIHKNICSKNIRISNQDNHEQEIKYINLSCNIDISYFNQHASYKLVLEIDPDKSLPFNKFEGFYTIKFSQDLKSESLNTYAVDNVLDTYYKQLPMKTSVIEDMDIKYVYDAIEKDDSNDSNHSEKLAELGFHPVHLNVELIKYTFSNVDNDENCSDNESVVKRKVRFIGKACIEDALTDYGNKKIKFRIFIEDDKEIKEIFSDFKNKIIPRADTKGCISWLDIIEHKTFNRGQYYPRKIHFVSEDLNLYGFTKAAINPWQRAFQSSQDISQINQNEIRTDTTGVPKPEMVINEFKSINLFPSYTLDKLLNINIFHSLYFLFQPFITRADNSALGRVSRGREILRDGHYILRILLLRNPQETGNVDRVIDPNEIEKVRNTKYLQRNHNDIKFIDKIVNGNLEGKYITHTDTIIKTNANFANFYLPLYFTKEQFFYLASRNMISIQVIPVDPAGFKFKKLTTERTTCDLDLEATEWKPYFDHDLIVKPYVGIFQMQNWTNWNVLQPMNKTFNTDKIIDTDKIGKKYRHFTLHSDSQPSSSATKPMLVSYKPNECTDNDIIESDNFNYDDCKQSNLNILNKEGIGAGTIEDHQIKTRLNDVKKDQDQLKKKITAENLVELFSEKNSLEYLDLDTQKGDEFMKDLYKSYEKSTDLYEKLIINQDVLNSVFDPEIRKKVQNEIKKTCKKWTIFSGYTLFSMKESDFYFKCSKKQVQKYIDYLIEKNEHTQIHTSYEDFINMEKENLQSEKAIQASMKKNIISKKNISSLMNIVFESIEDIVDKGIEHTNASDLENSIFMKSLCGFWFNSFYQKYLKVRQMGAAYTDYIKHFDYYRILETDTLTHNDKRSFIVNFMDLIQNSDESELKKCHINYGECVLNDHCKLRDHSDVKPYCQTFITKKDDSCMEILKEECKLDSSTSLCKKQVSIQNCGESIDQFCLLNPDQNICSKYHSRCLTNYYNCVSSENTGNDFKQSVLQEIKNDLFKESNKPDSPYSFIDSVKDMLKSDDVYDKTPMIKSCLENPKQFFQFESKMFIEDISYETPPRYIGGFSGNLAINGSFSTGSYMNWTAQRGTSLGIKHGSNVNLPLGNALPVGITALDVSLSKSISSNIANSGRRAVDVRVGEGAYLIMSRATFDIDVTKYKKCLIVKLNPNSLLGKLKNGLWKPYSDKFWSSDFQKNPYKKLFLSRPGLMICNAKKDVEDQPETIRESYYYITQSLVDPSNSQFLNLYDLSNRPFMAVLRGKQNFLNYFESLKLLMEGKDGDINNNTARQKVPSNLLIDYSHPLDEALSYSLTLRQFSKTGFHPGVYTYASSHNDFNHEYIKENKSWLEKIYKKYEGINYFLPLPTPASDTIPAQRYD